MAKHRKVAVDAALHGASRRRVLRYALGGVIVVLAAGVAGFELVERGTLPGKSTLDQLDGACDVAAPDLATYAPPGPQESGTFYSKARRTTVGYTIGVPPDYTAGENLPLVIALHGFGGNHTNALAGMSPAQAVALRSNTAKLALVTVDGGDGYWNPHPGDDPQAMLVEELIPLCQRKGLGAGTGRIGVMGISMGGYGAILLAERRVEWLRAVRRTQLHPRPERDTPVNPMRSPGPRGGTADGWWLTLLMELLWEGKTSEHRRRADRR